MNYDNYSDEGSCLNAINITSNVRAPGEYKYFYCGENSSASDKSFLVISPMWYTTKISEDMFLLSSCYTSLYTCFLYYNPQKSIYNIYVYQNILDYKNENISLKAIQIIQLNHSYKPKDIVISKTETTGQPIININVKIYFGADNYLLLNEVDRRILLIDFINGNYITIFYGKEEKSQDIYNIIDTYDEKYHVEGELRVRTYAFLSIKKQKNKSTSYEYRYFIIERGILENKNIFLHSIDLELGNAEPFDIKIARIPKQNPSVGDIKNQQWFYIFCFLSSQLLFQLVTNYDKLTLYQVLRNINQCNKKTSEKHSRTTIGYRKENQLKKDNDNKEKDDNNNTKQICFWYTPINVKIQIKQVAQSVRIFLNINTKKLCALILFFEMGAIASFPFNYNDPPEEIQNKITITSNEIQLDKIKEKEKDEDYNSNAKVCQFKEYYLFNSNTRCALTSKHLIFAIHNTFRIYDLYTKNMLYNYHFYKETISAFLLFEDIGATFLLTGTKIFKIIFNTRYKIFSENEIINNPNYKVNMYQFEGMNYPSFEYNPEDVWNSYCTKLGIETMLFKDIKSSHYNHIDIDDDEKKNNKKICVICSKEAEYYCSSCELKYYCCNEHFEYDYNNIHFFECQLVQFFRRKDIMTIKEIEIRYIVLYNELIKLCGRILNFMFTRIFEGKDCHNFLEMLLCLIALLDNFGFNVNFTEYCSCNLINPNPTDKSRRPEKVLFFQECLYFYVQLQMLKCTFTSKCKLYNLTDCYLKIIKNDIIPKLTPKASKKVQTLKCDKLRKYFFFNNEFFLNFQSPVFFDLKKIYNNAETNDLVDIVESYIIKHLMTLSIIIKYKIKLHSSIDVKDTIENITLMLDENVRDNKPDKNVSSYCYFSLSFYLVEIGKVSQTILLLKRTINIFTEKADSNTKLKALAFYNLGILQYAIGEFKIGIHNIEEAYKLIVSFFLSEKFKHKVMVSLGLAYLNQRNLFKAYVLIQSSIKELKKIKKQKYELKCIKLNVYLNYIIDLYEYSFITKTRLQINDTKKDKNYNIHQLINFVKGGNDKELIVIEQHVNEFLKVVEYIWNLPKDILEKLDNENRQKKNNNSREEYQHDKNSSFNNVEQSQMSTIYVKENGIDKEDNLIEYDEDIQVTPQLFDSLSRQQQKDFKELKSVFFKRDIILRDSLGDIEKFNINYDPVYSTQFQKIIEKLKSNFLLKEIFYCFQNEKWRDELYNYSPNNVLFGLSKYLKLEKIKNVIAIEKSKCLDIIKKEKNDRQSIIETDVLKKINCENNIYPNNNISMNNPAIINQNNNNISLFSRYKNEVMNYLQFKKKFTEALKENDKNKSGDNIQYLNLKDDYLVSLYKNVYLNDPGNNFIFQNPSLILNYIFIDISNNDTTQKEASELISQQKIKEDEHNNIINRKSSCFKSNLNNNEIFDNKIIFESKEDENMEYNNSSYDAPNFDKIIYLKYDINEDNLKIEAQEGFNYFFVRKKTRSVTSSWGGKFVPAFGRKRKKTERKSCVPDIFLKIANNNKSIKKKTENAKLKFESNDNIKKPYQYKKQSVVLRPGFLNNNENALVNTTKSKRKRKKDKSCSHLCERLSINSNIEYNDLIEPNLNKKVSSDSDSSDSDSSSDNKNINKKEEKNIFEVQKNEKGILNKKTDNKTNYNHISFNINKENNKNSNDNKMKAYKENNYIINNSVEVKKISKKSNIKINNDNNGKKIDINNLLSKKGNINKSNTEIVKNNLLSKKGNNKKNSEILQINNFKNNDKKELNNKRNNLSNSITKKNKNKKNELIKNNSVKQFSSILKKNNFINLINDKDKKKRDLSIILDKKKKDLTIITNKALVKPRTYNHFSSEQIKNHNNANKKISFISLSQKKDNKKHGYINRIEQEIELYNDAIEFLQHELNNINKRKIRENHLFSGFTMEDLQHKFKINENKINIRMNKNSYKVPYDYKKKRKQFGEESTISYNSTSSGFLLNKNSISFYDNGSSDFDNNRFKDEMHRIIEFNRKLKCCGKENNINYNDINISNKRLEKSISQPNFFRNRNKKNIMIGDKSSTSKGKHFSKSLKYYTPLSQTYNNINKFPNNDNNSSENFINCFKKNISNLKLSNKIGQNRALNNYELDNIYNIGINQKGFADYFEDEKEQIENKEFVIVEDKNEDENNHQNVKKFRSVLDKYLKNKKTKKQSKGKMEKKINNEEKKFKTKNKNKNKINNNDKNNNINDNKKAYNNNKDEYFEIEKLNNINLSKKEDQLNINKNIEMSYDNNNILNNLNNGVQIKTNEQSLDTSSFNRLGEDTNLKEKINIPFYISPQIKKKDILKFNNNNENSYQNSEINCSNPIDKKNHNITSIPQIQKGIDMIQNQKHNKPKKIFNNPK